MNNKWNEVIDQFLDVPSDKIFVFGSNLAGRHGKGAALWAVKNRGAKYGQGFGAQGRSYAIPTKDANLRILSIDIICSYVNFFIEEALASPETEYYLTPIGCGLAGYDPKLIAPLFIGAPRNVELPQVFIDNLKD